MSPLSAADVEAAAQRISGVVSPTALQFSDRLSQLTGAVVYLKREDLQVVRSYKLRGAYNLLMQLTPEEKAAGVVCSSAGNHAQGFALACRSMGIHGRVYVPAKTPKQKRDRIRYHGGEFIELIVGGPTYDLAAAAARDDVARTGATLVPPYDDPRTMAGQGTIAVEILQQLDDSKAEQVVTIDVSRKSTVADVMVPRVDISAIAADTPLDEVVRLIQAEAHSRYPIYRESLDDVIGMIHIKDVLAYWGTAKKFNLRDILRRVVFVAPTLPVLDMLLDMRRSRTHMALVVDEFGGTESVAAARLRRRSPSGVLRPDPARRGRPLSCAATDSGVVMPPRQARPKGWAGRQRKSILSRALLYRGNAPRCSTIANGLPFRRIAAFLHCCSPHADLDTRTQQPGKRQPPLTTCTLRSKRTSSALASVATV